MEKSYEEITIDELIKLYMTDIKEHKQYEISNGINFILNFKLQNTHSQRTINLISLDFTNQKLKQSFHL